MGKRITAFLFLALAGAFALVSACSKQASTDSGCSSSLPCSVSTNITN